MNFLQFQKQDIKINKIEIFSSGHFAYSKSLTVKHLPDKSVLDKAQF